MTEALLTSDIVERARRVSADAKQFLAEADAPDHKLTILANSGGMALEMLTAMADTIERLSALLVRSHEALSDELASMLDSYRICGQTDAATLARTDFHPLDAESFREMRSWRALLDDIETAGIAGSAE